MGIYIKKIKRKEDLALWVGVYQWTAMKKGNAVTAGIEKIFPLATKTKEICPLKKNIKKKKKSINDFELESGSNIQLSEDRV